MLLKLLLFAMAFMPAKPEKWIVQKGCTLKVDGSTNVNKFSCVIKDYADLDTLIFHRNSNDNLAVPVSGYLELPIFNFDCVNKLMTADLRKALKSKEFPNLRIYFLSLNKYPELRSTYETIPGIVNIELAGVVKRYAVNYKVAMDDKRTIHLVGIQNIRFSDFNLTRPRKAGGIIRADDQLAVEFHISFHVMNEGI